MPLARGSVASSVEPLTSAVARLRTLPVTSTSYERLRPLILEADTLLASVMAGDDDLGALEERFGALGDDAQRTIASRVSDFARRLSAGISARIESVTRQAARVPNTLAQTVLPILLAAKRDVERYAGAAGGFVDRVQTRMLLGVLATAAVVWALATRMR